MNRHPLMAHSFDARTGFSTFECLAPAARSVHLVGDFNHWRRGSLRLIRRGGRWHVRVRLAAGRYRFGFEVDGRVGSIAVAEVPLCFRPLTDAWLRAATHHWTCRAHRWKWN